MAIQTDIQQSVYGVPFQGAYMRIVNLNVERVHSQIFKFRVLISLAAYAAKPESELYREVESRRYQCPLEEIEIQSGDTFLARCYEWVMAQPDMVGAIAV